MTVETAPGVMTDAASWPVPGTKPTQLFLKPGAELGLAPAAGDEQTTTFQDLRSQRETAMLATPTTVTANRRVFLTPPLTAPVRVSGTPVVQLDASADKTSTHLGAILVDFGPAFPRVNRATGDGVQTLTTSDCWGQATPRTTAATSTSASASTPPRRRWRVSKGVLDAGHRTSRLTTTPIVAGQRYPFSFPLLPNDYTFPAGHQIGVVIVGSYRDYGTTASTTARQHHVLAEELADLAADRGRRCGRAAPRASRAASRPRPRRGHRLGRSWRRSPAARRPRRRCPPT